MSSPMPCESPSSPSTAPAIATCVKRMSREGEAQRESSLSRARWREMLKPQALLPGLNASVLKGILNSAVHPWSSIFVFTYQMPSQLMSG